MTYEMTPLLMKANSADFALLINRIDSYVNFSDDKGLKGTLAQYERDGLDSTKEQLVKMLEREIRYVGSADIAFAFRKMTSESEVAGVSFNEIVDDVSRKLKVKQRLVGTPEAKVERIVKYTVEKTFFAMTEEQQRELFTKAGVERAQQDELLKKFTGNKLNFLPLLLSVLGPEITMVIIQGLAISALAAFIGRKAAEELIKNLIGRFPWWAEWLGPIVWGLSLGWLAVDLQGAAFRKTIPIILYLGIVGLRDGPEDGAEFWADTAAVA